MASLISSADELLKTRTIPELRELVYSLENDGNSKITELQVMVGSKYHDFIQSADAIAAMQEKSEFLEVNLCGCLKLSQDVVSRTTDLLSRTLEEKADSKLVSRFKLYKLIDSHDVWSSLEECDIFGAAKIIVQAKIFLETHNTSLVMRNDNALAFPLPFCRFFSASAFSEVGLSSESGAIKNLSMALAGCSSAIFLSQTVLDDARLFLLEGSCSSEEKARTLASVGLLTKDISSNGNNGMRRGDLLLMYLEGADLLLDAAIEGLGERNLQTQTTHDLPTGKGKPVAVTKKITHSGSIMGEKLVQAVLMLQQTILDVHSLFFKPATLSDPTLNSALTVPGLVVQKQLEFINDIDRAFSPLLQNSSSKNKGGLGFDCTAFLADDKTCSPPLEIRNIFDQWLVKAVQRVGERARAALEAMGSATEVARLQQRVWLCCTTVTTGALSSDVTTSGLPSSVSGYTQTNWEESCVELLAVKRRRTSTLDSNSAATSLLWSRVFRLPFMLQVERLLRESCMGVLRGAKGLLLQALFQEGVVIDSITLTASLVPSVGRGGSVASSSPSSSSSSGMDLDYSYTSLCAPSPRIFRKAESVRCLLQDELSDLLRDIIVPVQEGDPESSTGLSRALFIQCSQLSGHIAVLLRCLCVSLTSAIDANVKASQVEGKLAKHERSQRNELSSNAPLLSGLLLVGRLSWLLKIRGRFLEEALVPALSSSGSAPSTSDAASIIYDLVSEDQMRSAFEIADTNGDGVLTYTEAIEAVHALAVTDTDSYLSSVSGAQGSSNVSSGLPSSGSIPFLSPRLSPSLNFNEFALLCAHLMSASACSPVERLKSCFNETLSMAHTQWAKRVVDIYTPSLTAGLTAELGSPTEKDANSTVGPVSYIFTESNIAPFRSTWKQVWVELDPLTESSPENPADPESSNREQVALPTSICSSLATFLFSLSHTAACSLLSVDTVHQLPPADLFTSTPLILEDDRDERIEFVDRIAHFASTALYSMAISATVSAYSLLLKKSNSSSGKKLSEEDVALQVVFDLLVCEALGDRCGVEQLDGLRECAAGWRARLDPINAEILMPLLTTASEQFALKNHLLLPGLRKPKEIPVSVNAVAVSSSSSLAAISSNASSISGLFPVTAASRFSLLPLPMSTHFQGSSWVERDRERSSITAEKADDYSGFAAKSLLSGLALSQQQQTHAEQLGKSLISTWGTFLGQTQ